MLAQTRLPRHTNNLEPPAEPVAPTHLKDQGVQGRQGRIPQVDQVAPHPHRRLAPEAHSEPEVSCPRAHLPQCPERMKYPAATPYSGIAIMVPT